MNEVTFLQNFKHVANAPDGVQRLRELILQLAAMGRLVPRVAGEGDAESLVAAIFNERERLADEGGVRLASPLPDVDSGSQSVPVPNHWRWIRLGNLTSKIGSGSTPRGGSKVYVSDGVPFLRSQNIWNDGVRLDDVVFISAETHAKMRNTHVVPNDILLNITGASLGRCAIAPVDFPAANVSQHVTIIRPLLTETRHFLHICFLSPFGQGMIWGRQVGMAREGLSKKVLEQFEIPLPPLEEQKRIVAKVDELMRLCDRLEAQQQEREKLLPLLSRANHTRFVTEPTEATLHPIFGQIGKVSPDDLRGTVFQLAVIGQLVPRIESEGDTESLLETVFQARQQQADESGTRISSPLPDVDPSPQFPPIPKHWRWVRLGNLTAKIGSGSTPRGGAKVYVSSGVPFLRSQNIWNDGIRLVDVAYIAPETHHKMRNTHVLANDILLNITGASLGRCAKVPSDFTTANVSQHVTIIRPLLSETQHFLHICLLSPFGQGMIWDRQVGMAREGLSKKVLEQFEIPLPPLEEQLRIVQRVEYLLELVDRLSDKKSASAHTSQLFATAAVAAITSTEFTESERMKPPKTKVVTALKVGQKPKKPDAAPLATLLSERKAEVSAKTLWLLSGLEIDAFYRQLKTEMANGWITEPEKAFVKEVEAR